MLNYAHKCISGLQNQRKKAQTPFINYNMKLFKCYSNLINVLIIWDKDLILMLTRLKAFA